MLGVKYNARTQQEILITATTKPKGNRKMTTAKTANEENNGNNEKFIITTFKKEGGIDVVKGFLEKEFDKYSAEAATEVPEIDSEAGRKRIKALAAQVNKKLSELDTPIRDYLRDIKKQPKLIEAVAKENKTKFTELRADILKPLEEAQTEQDRLLLWLNEIPVFCAGNSDVELTSENLKGTIHSLEKFDISEIWPELRKKFSLAHENALTTATVTLERIEQQEAQAAELEELRKKQAASDKAEEERKIKEEAANKARIEAEEKAQRDREDVDRRAAESKQREETAKQAEAKAKRDAELAKEQQRQAAEQAKIDAENERIASEKRQAEAVELAKKQEAARIAEQEAAQAAQAKAREADKEHRIKINRSAMVDLIAAGIDEEVAKDVIRAIARKQVRNVSIQY